MKTSCFDHFHPFPIYVVRSIGMGCSGPSADFVSNPGLVTGVA